MAAFIYWITPSITPEAKTDPIKSESVRPRSPVDLPQKTNNATSATSATPMRGDNAADLYKNAYSGWVALADEEKQILANPLEEIDPEKADALFKKIQPIMEALRKGTQAAYCDWSVGVAAPNTPQPQFTLVKDLSQVTRWSAGFQFQTSHPEGALSDLSVQLNLGRSVGAQSLFGFAIESSLNGMASSLVRDNASSLPPEALSAALALFDPARLTADFMKAAADEADLYAQAANPIPNPDGTHQESGESLKWKAKVNTDFISKVMRPDSEFNNWLEQETRQSPGDQPGATTAHLAAIRTRYLYTLENNFMLTAGLAVLQSGSSQVQSYLDPMTGAPLVYVQTDNGFELQSSAKINGIPVKLSFPTPDK